MSLKVQASFAAGELDPALHERTNLQKYNSGLATARNVIIGKTGRVISRAGRKHFKSCKTANRKVKIHIMDYAGSYLEWGHLYVRVYTLAGTLIGDYAHALTEDDLDYIHFVDTGGIHVLVFRSGEFCLSLTITGSGGFLIPYTDIFDLPAAPTWISGSSSGTGYAVEYQFTCVVNGQESTPFDVGSIYSLPILNLEENIIVMRGGLDSTNITEIRAYRRPEQGAAYGYVGSTNYYVVSGLYRHFTFKDVGQAADYTHQPPIPCPTLYDAMATNPAVLESVTGTMYQGRLLLSSGAGIEASRPRYIYNFYRDFPYTSDSALSLKPGSDGVPTVMRMIDSDGLVVFTRMGVYVHTGAMGPDNLAIVRKGPWVIDDRVPPVAIPGGVLFVDRLTNSVRHLKPSNESGYLAEDLTVYSEHLFTGKRVTSWAFEESDIPVLWVVLNDGSFLSFNFVKEQEMRAWTRHDSSVTVEYVAAAKRGIDQLTGLFTDPVVLFVINNGGSRAVEKVVPRFVSGDTLTDDPEAYMGESIAAMDSMVTFKTLINDNLSGTDVMTMTPVTAGVWDGPLTLSCPLASSIFTSPGYGAVGVFFRFFNPDDGATTDLEVTARASNLSITVEPSSEWPSDYASGFRLYLLRTTFTGMTQMGSETVSVVADGYVVGSPNNDVENYATCTLAAGAITLPNSLKSAITHVGRPITYDVGTLAIDTVEQRPVLLEAKTANKAYVKVHRSGALYIGTEFPDEDKVAGMESLDELAVDYEDEIPILGNRYQAPTTERVEVTLPGSWDTEGRLCIRQVDPIHFEILSIIPDLEDLKR